MRRRPGFYKTQLERAQAATAAEVGAAAKRWLSDGVYMLEVQPFPQLAAGAAGADRKKPPGPGRRPRARLPAIQRATLPNGLKLIVAERHERAGRPDDLLVDAG